MSGYGYYHGMGDGWSWMMFGGFFWILLMVFLVLGLAWSLRGGGARQVLPPAERRSVGLDILEERYARGEIEREEFLQKKADLLHPHQQAPK